LLDGQLGDGARLWESAAALKLPQTGTFVVVAAECPPPARRALPGIEDVLRRNDVVSPGAWTPSSKRTWSCSDPVSTRPRSAPSWPSRPSAESVSASPYDNLEQTASALRQARLACAAPPRTPPNLVRFDQEPFAVLLVSAPDAAE